MNLRNIINYVKAQRLGWFGHENRMPETSIVRKIYKWKPSTSRPVGMPKSRWEDDVRNDLRKMKPIKWTEQVQNRLKWNFIVEKAKILSELKKKKRNGTAQRRTRRLLKIINNFKISC